MSSVYCLQCDYSITLKQPRLGQYVHCQNCWTEFEVVGLVPIEIDWADDASDNWENWELEDLEDFNG